MHAVILGTAGLLVGALVALYGVRVFYVLLPLFGLVAGFALGAQGAAALLNEGYLATLVGWAVGLVVGIALAVTATVWFWAAVLVLAFGVGSSLGSGLLLAIGFEPGILPFVAAIVGGVALVLVAIALDAPTILVAVLTSFGGAAFVMAGAALILGIVEPDALGGGVIGALRGQPLVMAGWLCLSVVALVGQLLEVSGGTAGLRTRLDRSVA